jgi:hypothetical protein
VYYLSYPHEIDTRWYDAYVERYDDDDVIHVYQEENEGHQSLSFTVTAGPDSQN